MTRSQRTWHAWIWMLLTPALAAGVVIGSIARRNPPGNTAVIPQPEPKPIMGPEPPPVQRERR